MSDFRKLHVWQKALALSLAVDRVCKNISSTHYASLRSQLFRAATSIPANIAEGRRQESEKEFARFLRYALNSSSELESHLIFAHRSGVISEADFRSLVAQTIRVRKMLYALLKRLAVDDRHPRRQCARAKQLARTPRPTRPRPRAGSPRFAVFGYPAGSRQLQFLSAIRSVFVGSCQALRSGARVARHRSCLAPGDRRPRLAAR